MVCINLFYQALSAIANGFRSAEVSGKTHVLVGMTPLLMLDSTQKGPK